MKNIVRCFGSNLMLSSNSSKACQLSCEKYLKYSTAAAYKISNSEPREKKELHPYRKIHPWRSIKEFSQSLVQNIVYNKNGLVALNKPYGIASRNKDKNNTKVPYRAESPNVIPGGVEYTISDCLPFIAKKLGYANLKIVRSPERYMSGVTLLAADETVEKAVTKSQNRALGLQRIPKTYWIVTTRLPRHRNGVEHLAIKLHKSPCNKFERPVLHENWSNLQVKRNEVKLMNVEYNILSNSPNDISALVELKSSTTKWHAIRLFAATRLLSPVLGDRIHGSRVQSIMGTWMKVNAFAATVDNPPKLSPKIFTHLNLSTTSHDIIPAHIHFKRIELTWYLGKNKDLLIEAPLMPEFAWTCQALNLKLPIESDSSRKDSSEDQEEQSVEINQ